MPRLLVAALGDAFVDVHVSGVPRLPSWGCDTACAGVRLLIGGCCANTARQLAAIGRPDSIHVAFFSAVGDDQLGELFVSTVEAEGLLLEPRRTIGVLGGAAQSACVVLAAHADRAMLSCYSSVTRLECSHFERTALQPEWPDEASSWRLLHIGGYFNCTGIHTPKLIQIVKLMRERGCVISLDPQCDVSGKWTGEDGNLLELLPLVDVLLPNESEASGISGGDGTAAEALERLAQSHPSVLVVIKCGGEGAVAARGTRRWRCAPFPCQAVDATGAGDAFNAGFLKAYLLNAADVAGALRAGCAAGSLAVRVDGACSPPLTPEAYAAVISGSPQPELREWVVSQTDSEQG